MISHASGGVLISASALCATVGQEGAPTLTSSRRGTAWTAS